MIAGIAMVSFGVVRGEAEAVLAKAIRLCLDRVLRNWIKEGIPYRTGGAIPRIDSGGGDARDLNLHLPNFAKGGIYQGRVRPSACRASTATRPAASGACPIGSFQSVVGSSKFSFSYYVTGTLILIGVLLGRFVCGFLCPFGWLQELLHKIPSTTSPPKAQAAHVHQVRGAAVFRGAAARLAWSTM